MNNTCDFLIVGGGIVGLSIAYQLIERKISRRIIILDKENSLGLHSSGRNSGVMHAGIYYEPNSLKAKVCVSGAKRLKEWIKDRGISIKDCGKLIVPQKSNLDPQLDVLYKRGKDNGADVEFIDSNQIKKLVPEVNITTGRAIWSPNTSVVDPLQVIKKIQEELEKKGVEIIKSVKSIKICKKSSEVLINEKIKISYSFFVNSAGLQADKIAHNFGVGLEYKIIPFKGIYWKLSKNCPFKIKLNLYPVPDLNVPFLGVHFTPSPHDNTVSIGPTAIPAFGRENYKVFEKLEPKNTIIDFTFLAKQYITNKDGFRKYVNEQAFLGVPLLFLNSAKELLPSLQYKHLQRSTKVGLRAQLFNISENKIIKDFLCLKGERSLHIINAISPAFTASFSFADYVIDNYLLKEVDKL